MIPALQRDFLEKEKTCIFLLYQLKDKMYFSEMTD